MHFNYILCYQQLDILSIQDRVGGSD